MKSICFFNKFKSWGGGEKWHYEAANFFLESGYNVSMICHRNGKLIQKIQENKKINVHKVPGRKYAYLNLFVLAKMYLFFKKNKTDIVIFNSEEDVRLGIFAARLAGIKVKIYRNGMPKYIKDEKMQDIFIKYIDKIFTNSGETKKLMEEKNKFLEGKVDIVKNGIKIIPESMDFTTKNDPVILGNAARFDHQKDQETILEALKILKDRDMKFKFLIAGDGEKESALKSLKDKLDLEEVSFLGFLNDTSELYKKIDVFILSSIFEGSSNSLIEAMGHGNAVVVSNIDSNMEIIGNDEYGVSYKVGNCEDLAGKLYKILREDSEISRLKEMAQNRIRRAYDYYHNMRDFEAKLTDLYQNEN